METNHIPTAEDLMALTTAGLRDILANASEQMDALYEPASAWEQGPAYKAWANVEDMAMTLLAGAR